jgi:hypothetical protein
MCTGVSHDEFAADFERRVEEREFPTCPPHGRRRLLFSRDNGDVEFHHGALFAFTRWTNLFFPLRQLFWGDAIGGPIASLFGSFVSDRSVAANQAGKFTFFSHTSYWNTTGSEGWQAPNIEELELALDLADLRKNACREQTKSKI